MNIKHLTTGAVSLASIFWVVTAPVVSAVEGSYFGNGSIKGVKPSIYFYNSIRFKVLKNGNVTGTGISYSAGLAPEKKLMLRGKISKIKTSGSGLKSATLTGKFSDGATFSGKLSLNSGGVKSAKGTIKKGAASGSFYGDGSGGSIVHIYSSDIEVTNLSTGNKTKFPALPFAEGGASVSLDGTIAHLQERDRNPEGVLVRLNRLDGTLIREFVWGEPYSFVRDGARISPNGKHVALCLRVPSDRGAVRTYVFDTAPPHNYTFWEYTCSPGWTIDNKLIAVSERGNQMFISNPEINYLSLVGPNNLVGAEAPEGSTDGKSIVFSDGAGIPRTFSMNIASGAVNQLLSGSVGQFRPVCGGNSIFYVQSCCSGAASLPTIHHVRQGLQGMVPLTIGGYFLSDKTGDSLNVSSRFGYTPASR